MIEINLLPGSGKKARSGGAGVNLSGALSGMAARVKDPFLAGAMAAIVIAVLAIGGMFWKTRAEANTLLEGLQRAQADSIRYASIIKEKHKAETQRDSVLKQMALISAFDDKRYVWPHLLDEISRALPPYTWLTSVEQTNITTDDPQRALPQRPAAAAKNGKNAKPDSAADADSTAGPPQVKLRIIGNTVDIQALTRFMRLLEASPFLQNVQLVKSALIIVDNKEVTEFTVDAEYEVPDASVIRKTPFTLSVR
ncbi:MAG TPA: PilN domain-containing protein [Gemmatimonadaceae bacterium]|nr:PilN domain-containing protein [Gemmatimonadaceae bacterium]